MSSSNILHKNCIFVQKLFAPAFLTCITWDKYSFFCSDKDDLGVDVSKPSVVDNASADCTQVSASFTLGNEETSLGCMSSKIKESEVETLPKTKDDNYLICYTTLEGLLKNRSISKIISEKFFET